MIRIERLYVSPGHNFFGHNGKAPDTNPMIAVPEVECVAGRGLCGDRFFDYKPDYRGQITFFSLEIFERLCAELGVAGVPSCAVRRNAFTRGVDLNTLIGVEFEIQGLRFAGVEECKPCYWMDQAVASGAEAGLKGNGGLRARILTDGWLRVDVPSPKSRIVS